MPQLISHRDGFSWQTPNVADILEPGNEPHDKTGQLRVHASLMVRKLAQLGAPARLAGVRPFSSHTRYQLNASQATDVGMLWTNPSGDTLIGVWGTDFPLGQAIPLHFGVISHGTFTPLRLPPGLNLSSGPGGIAW